MQLYKERERKRVMPDFTMTLLWSFNLCIEGGYRHANGASVGENSTCRVNIQQFACK